MYEFTIRTQNRQVDSRIRGIPSVQLHRSFVLGPGPCFHKTSETVYIAITYKKSCFSQKDILLTNENGCLHSCNHKAEVTFPRHESGKRMNSCTVRAVASIMFFFFFRLNICSRSRPVLTQQYGKVPGQPSICTVLFCRPGLRAIDLNRASCKYKDVASLQPVLPWL